MLIDRHTHVDTVGYSHSEFVTGMVWVDVKWHRKEGRITPILPTILRRGFILRNFPAILEYHSQGMVVCRVLCVVCSRCSVLRSKTPRVWCSILVTHSWYSTGNQYSLYPPHYRTPTIPVLYPQKSTHEPPVPTPAVADASTIPDPSGVENSECSPWCRTPPTKHDNHKK